MLTPLGIGPDTEVFLYDDARQHDSARAWWLLGYAGVGAGLIDGGFKLWEREHRPVSSEAPARRPPRLHRPVPPRAVAGRADVPAAVKSGDAQILDARSAAEYRGEAPAGAQARPGEATGPHPDGPLVRGLRPGRCRRTFPGPRGPARPPVEGRVRRGKPVIAYSAGEPRSALVVFALRRLEIPARHYHAGLGDWLKDAVGTDRHGRPARGGPRRSRPGLHRSVARGRIEMIRRHPPTSHPDVPSRAREGQTHPLPRDNGAIEDADQAISGRRRHPDQPRPLALATVEEGDDGPRLRLVLAAGAGTPPRTEVRLAGEEAAALLRWLRSAPST